MSMCQEGLRVCSGQRPVVNEGEKEQIRLQGSVH